MLFLHCSAPLNRGLKDVRILAVVVAELEFGDIQRKIFCSDLVMGTRDAALEQRPEAFNGVRMNRAYDVLASSMVHNAVRVVQTERRMASMCVGAEQADLVRYSSTDEAGQGFTAGLLDHVSNNAAFATYSADHDSFTHTTGTAALVLVPVLGFATHVGFVNLNDVHKLLEVLTTQHFTAVPLERTFQLPKSLT
jgi:hypothetical protein